MECDFSPLNSLLQRDLEVNKPSSFETRLPAVRTLYDLAMGTSSQYFGSSLFLFDVIRFRSTN